MQGDYHVCCARCPLLATVCTVLYIVVWIRHGLVFRICLIVEKGRSGGNIRLQMGRAFRVFDLLGLSVLYCTQHHLWRVS